MSTEQAQGMEVDHRSDIWAVGVVLYEMVCGQRPFQGEYDQALLFEIVHQEPEPLTGVRAGVPMELEFIVGKCLAKTHRTATKQQRTRLSICEPAPRSSSRGDPRFCGRALLGRYKSRPRPRALKQQPILMPVGNKLEPAVRSERSNCPG